MKSEDKWKSLIKDSEICQGAKPINIPMPWCLGMSEANNLCKKLGGHMTVMSDLQMQEDIISKHQRFLDLSGCIFLEDSACLWTGFTDERVEGQFIDVNKGENLESLFNSSPMAPGEPNGDKEENCIFSCVKRPFWYDVRCSTALTSFCSIGENPWIQIRGNEEHVMPHSDINTQQLF